jgi:hypothetical protein
MEAVPAVDDDESFTRRVDEWLVTQDLAPTVKKDPPLHDFAPEHEPPAKPLADHEPGVRRKAPVSSSWRDVNGELRSETYMQRLGRVWSKRVGIAAACVLALNVAVAGATSISNRLTGLIMAEPVLPEPPDRPTLAVPIIVLPAAPAIAAARAVVSGEYLVAVGLFASAERADRLVHELMQAGLRVCQRPFQLRSQSVQQVVLGPFGNRADAVADLQRLRSRGGHDDAQVVVASNGPDSPCMAAPRASRPAPLRVASPAQ